MPAVIRAWKGQSLPPTQIVVVDNSPDPNRIDYIARTREWQELGVYDTWRINKNLGPLCRLWPALALAPLYDYILFADDDLLPGINGLLSAVETAKRLNDKFATIGQEGRTFQRHDPCQHSEQGARPTYSYKFGDTPRWDDSSRLVDCTVRCHLVLARYLQRVLHLREKLPANLCSDHDDLLLCLGLQIDPGWPSYILPNSTSQRQLIRENLPGCNGPEACWKRPDHLQQRTSFIRLAQDSGWCSFVN
jgi:hypothetical protein